jgi:hypothetical protein
MCISGRPGKWGDRQEIGQEVGRCYLKRSRSRSRPHAIASNGVEMAITRLDNQAGK